MDWFFLNCPLSIFRQFGHSLTCIHAHTFRTTPNFQIARASLETSRMYLSNELFVIIIDERVKKLNCYHVMKQFQKYRCFTKNVNFVARDLTSPIDIGPYYWVTLKYIFYTKKYILFGMIQFLVLFFLLVS